MYIIVRSEEVPGPKNPIRLGYPEDMAPNITFLSTGSFSSAMNFNAKILRESLLNSSELLKSLGLKVIDLVKAAEEKPAPKPAPKKKTTKAKPKVEEPVEPVDTAKTDDFEEPIEGEQGVPGDDPGIPVITGDQDGDEEWK